MRAQLILPTPGLPAFAHAINQYPLPTGLKHGDPLTVLTGTPAMTVRVKNADGREFEIFHWQCDCGRVYEIGGEWRAPHDPLVRAHLNEELRRPVPADATLAQLYAESFAGTREVLVRWG